MVQLKISSSRQGGRNFTVNVNAEATITDVKTAIYAKNKKVNTFATVILFSRLPVLFLSEILYWWRTLVLFSYFLIFLFFLSFCDQRLTLLFYHQLYPARQRLTLAVDSSKRLTDETKLRDSFGGQLEDGLELTLKDLGPQIDWRTVFFFEYVS